jgi:branched-chain amino acid transport system substrate-binding protein
MDPCQGQCRRHPSARVRMCVGVAAGLVGALVLAACSSSGASGGGVSGGSVGGASGVGGGGAAAPGVSAKSINIGVVTDETGGLAYQGTVFTKAFQAVIDSVNAGGGIYGRKINLIVEDDQSTPDGNLAATQSVVEAHGAFAVVELSGVAQGSAAYLGSKSVPTFTPGLQALDQNYPNLFTANGGVDSNPDHNTTALGDAFKFLGATKVGGLTFSCAPCAVGVTQGIASASAAGLDSGYKNVTLANGVTDWTPYVNEMKSSGTDGDWSILELPDALGYYSALDGAGVKMTKISVDLFGNQYLTGASKSAMQGVYVQAWYQPAQISTSATGEEVSILKKYGGSSGLPDWATTNGYVVGQLVKTALQTAGPNPTRASLISKLRAVTSWNAAGLAAQPVDFSKQFTAPTQPGYGPGNCFWLLKVSGDQFTPARQTPFCGATIATKS